MKPKTAMQKKKTGRRWDPLETQRAAAMNKELAVIPAAIYETKEILNFWIEKGGPGASAIFARELVWLVRRERELLALCSDREKSEYGFFCEQLTKISAFRLES